VSKVSNPDSQQAKPFAFRPSAPQVIEGLERECGDGIAQYSDVMRLNIQNKVTCGFLILAFAMMIGDCYHLLRAPSNAASSATSSGQYARKF
jgi:hypothetical protein